MIAFDDDSARSSECYGGLKSLERKDKKLASW